MEKKIRMVWCQNPVNVDLHPNEEKKKTNTNSIKSKSSQGTVLGDETQECRPSATLEQELFKEYKQQNIYRNSEIQYRENQQFNTIRRVIIDSLSTSSQ